MCMAKRKYARDPMLYIQQPDNKIPKASMQHSYRTKKISSGSSGTGQSRSRSFIDEEREARLNAKNEEFKEEFSTEDDEQVRHPEEENKRKKFNERRQEEKINYFADEPA